MAYKRPARRGRRQTLAGSDDSVVEEHQPAKRPSPPEVDEEEEVEGSQSDQPREETDDVAGDAAIGAPPKRAARPKKKPTAKKNPPPSDKSPAHKTKRKRASGGKIAKSNKRNSKKVKGTSAPSDDDKSFDEMCQIYPQVAHEVKLIAEAVPHLKSSFTGLADKRARLIEKKLEKVKWKELKLQTRMSAEVQAPKAELRNKLLNLLVQVSKDA